VGRGVALFQVVRVTTLGGHRLMLSILGLLLLLRLAWALFSRERLVGVVVPSWWEEYLP